MDTEHIHDWDIDGENIYCRSCPTQFNRSWALAMLDIVSIEAVEAYLATLPWSDNVPDEWISIAHGNIRAFASHVRAALRATSNDA